jgi:lipopolysaccharide/colanic/teichoic acid biosynthesis glycosyltransferase
MNHNDLFMTLRTYWKRIDPFKYLRESVKVEAILTQREFQAMLELERCQADRIGYEFSLVVFEFQTTGDVTFLTEQLALLLKGRVRITDKVGWFDETHIGVILAGTSAEGALKFADEISSRGSHKTTRLVFQTYTYPSTGSGSGNFRSVEGRADGASLNSEAVTIASRNSIDPHDGVHLTESRGVYEGTKQEPFKSLESILVNPMPVWKRTVDIVCSLIGLVLVFPLFVAISFLIRIVSPGPILFKQERAGYLGRPFTVLKFRTMRNGTDDSVHRQHVRNLLRSGSSLTKLDSFQDSRIIPFGKSLRKLGLDELPQLINILRGEMSVVGPRPDVLYAVQDYLRWNIGRLDAVPGLTGLWQVSGKNSTTFKEMARMDINYVRNKSLWLDLKIIALTVPSILLRFRKNGFVSKTNYPETRSNMFACKAMISRKADRTTLSRWSDRGNATFSWIYPK